MFTWLPWPSSEHGLQALGEIEPVHVAAYRIEIRGMPSMALDLELGAFGRNTALDAGFAVGAHVANAIPVVCEARCGVRSFLDLPPITGRHTMLR